MDYFPPIASRVEAFWVSWRFQKQTAPVAGGTSFFIVLFSVLCFSFAGLRGRAQILHSEECFPNGTTFTLDWSTVGWTPAGSTTFNLNNFDGSATSISYNVAFSVSGETGSLTTENGVSTPGVTTSLSGGTGALHISSTGLNSDENITLRMSFTPAIAGRISFDIYNIIQQSVTGDDPGQNVLVYAQTTSGFVLVPELVDNGSPSWDIDGPGVANGNTGSTSGTNDQVGVNIQSLEDVTDVYVRLKRCTACGLATNTEFAIGDLFFCLIPDTDQDGTDDFSDQDDDNDGIYDNVEKCPNPAVYTFDWDNYSWGSGNSEQFTMPDGTTFNAFAESNGAVAVSVDINSNLTGGFGSGTDGWFLNADQLVQSQSIDVIMDFSEAIDSLSFRIFDVDALSGQYTDSLIITGYYNGFVVFPTLTGSTNATVNVNRATGTASVADNSGTANVLVEFDQPLDSVAIFYTNGVSAPASPGNQWITIHDLTYKGDCGSVDSDGDGYDDYLDIDADNDGIVDYIEWQSSTSSPISPAGSDSDADGIDNNFESSLGDPRDTDGDGIPDFRDPDSDDDGDLDMLEAYDTDNDGVANSSATGTDADEDGLDDGFDNQNGWNSTTNITNGGQTSSNLPNLDDPVTAERDWREQDSDGDGAQDYADLDDDNDGIPDTEEVESGYDPSGDEDGDGIPNFADTIDNGDSGDGSTSSYTDTDADGTPDAFDQDEDGIRNQLDIDADNDGITDLRESGIASATITTLDADNNGIIDAGNTFGTNGLVNTVETSADNGTLNYTVRDTDADGILPNFLDIDSDDDGIVDYIEAQVTSATPSAPSGSDSDSDGLDDTFETGGLVPVDTDNDGTPDYYDTDSDADTDSDVLEGYDTDNDGTANTTASGSDTDRDGLDNNFDNVNGSNTTTNVTNNGQTSGSFPNLDSPGTSERDWRETPPDADGDGIINNLDNDCDNDGIPDSTEGYGDSDGDGYSDACDADSDNDGIPDIVESGGTDADGNGLADDSTDNDSDGIPDTYDPSVSGTSADLSQDCSGTTAGYNHNVSLAISTTDLPGTATLTWYLRGDYNQGQSNENITVFGEGGTNLGTYYRTNSNITNYSDCGTTPMQFSISISAANWNSWNSDGLLTLTFDAGSGVNSSCTDYSCLDSVRVDYAFTSGTPLGSVDTDGDGVDDRLDLNADNDGITDIAEAGGVDTDGDGRVDSPTDSDGNGLSDEYDVDNGGTPITNRDTDGDGLNDMLDLDADNDGIPDVVEAGGTDTNGDGYPEDLGDTDGDGLADDVDGDVGNDGVAENSADALILTGPDANSDGIPDSYPQDDEDSDDLYNHIDLDSDGDAIPDVVEAGGTDADGDGFADDFSDTDNDGLNDELDGSICSAASGNGTYLSGSSTGITNGTNASGASDGAFAQIHDSGDLLVLDFGQVLPVGTNYTLTWRRKSSYSFGATADMQVEESADNSTYGTNSVTPATTSITTFISTVMTAEVATRYVRLSELTGTNDDIDFDAVAFSYNNCVSGDPLQLTGADTDNDGAPDSYPEDDFDNDGTRDQLDRDSDNDGIPDVVEAGGTDTNGDGRFDDQADTDDDGLADDIDGDVGNNSVAENTANALQVTGTDANSDGAPDSYSVDDTDADGQRDQLDLDSDNDGIPDVVEAGGVDTDGDGYFDNQNDTDGDGFADDVDGDAGNDGVAENTASALQVTGTDTDSDGAPDSYPTDDFDNDGILNQLDIDADNDGITDVVEAGGNPDANGRLVAATTDSDGDGFGDGVDGDVGNDGTAENSTGALCLTGSDSNNDGAPDSYPNDDPDGDTHYNFIDIDADDDGIVDNIEAQVTTGSLQPGGLDSDGDGLDNNFEAAGLTPVDTDADGTPDYQDSDSDNDGYTDLLEGWDTTGDNVADTSPAGADTDGDGLDNNFDNVTGPNATTNPSNNGQLATDFPNLDNAATNERDWRELQDTDSDGVADNIDLDDDNDGIPDEDEAAGNEPDGDEDGDDIPNFFDTTDNGNGGDGSVTSYTDVNADGIPDIYDFDRDGVPNHLDKDGDNDGIADILEAGGADTNQDGEIDYPTPGDPITMTDADNDGLSDNVDDREGAVTGGTPLPEPNTDGTAGVNYLDIDADDDGIVDLIEAQASTGSPIIPLGADSDGDGIDDAFDTDNGGTYIAPENTDGTDTPDYIDTNSDNDGEMDLLEGWDTDGDGTADTDPSGADADNDGLDNNFDLVNGINATTNVHNSGQNSGDFPNADAGSAELDWREQPCFGGVVSLAPNNDITIASDYCKDGDWTYYYDPAQPTELLFAIEHKPAGGNTNDFTARAELTVSSDPLTAAGVYGTANVLSGQAAFVMGRYWNLQLVSGSLNGAVNIRFFYDPAEADMLETTAESWNDAFAGSTPFVSGRRWFMVTSGTFDHASPDLLSNGVQGSMELFPSLSGTEDGETYVQFEGLTSLTGGGLAYTIGTNSVVLPVELLSFDAQPFAYHEVLTMWVTATEINSDRFEIERSPDGVHWSRVGEVAAAGNSAEAISYEWIDREALAGKSYYRIRQVDQDGKYQYSQVREVEFTDEGEEQIAVFPNPSNGLITLFLGAAMPGEGSLEVYNSVGQLVLSHPVLPSQNRMEIDLSLFGPGVYSLQYSSARGMQTLPVIVE